MRIPVGAFSMCFGVGHRAGHQHPSALARARCARGGLGECRERNFCLLDSRVFRPLCLAAYALVHEVQAAKQGSSERRGRRRAASLRLSIAISHTSIGLAGGRKGGRPDGRTVDGGRRAARRALGRAVGWSGGRAGGRGLSPRNLPLLSQSWRHLAWGRATLLNVSVPERGPVTFSAGRQPLPKSGQLRWKSPNFGRNRAELGRGFGEKRSKSNPGNRPDVGQVRPSAAKFGPV